MEMMPSPNLDHTYQDFHDLNWCVSSHEWIHQSLMNYNVQTSNCTDHLRGLLNQRTSNPIEPPALNPSLTLSQVMARDLGFQGCIRDNDHINQQGHQQGQEAAQSHYLPRIKEEISRETLPKLFGGFIHEHYRMIDEKLLARALQNSSHNLLLPLTTEDHFASNGSSINGFVNSTSHDNSYNTALPKVNTSSLYSYPLLLPGILDMDLHLHAFDVFDASRPKPFMMREEEAILLGPTTTLMQQMVQGTCTNHPKIQSSLSGVAEKIVVNNSILDSKTSQCHQAIHRKSQLEPRSPSFSSFKVRKEKLGDRIAALQQLVAPFGKTDTASVLMEAIGYIKFLQDQVETLSVPYMRLSKNKKQRTTQGEASEIEKEEAKVDLRSRGLCLMPLSCTSYVTNENGGVWSSLNFRGSV
ncbi:basic helix-loop-helix (bHLH) DNA-binding superfamily protein [Rhynchospora pubera]|uniref:Basic helix-loop-helix (BHLH) DNA-binding superfamily protein n=1 Tax=Rhynchospora pubera TaxID=906938 RepID=A0AAV8CAN2_9POAL|nr:basic helix-loop-helix (bHLH) DNA-binding superfamily protein [Rhynchospora pubera]